MIRMWWSLYWGSFFFCLEIARVGGRFNYFLRDYQRDGVEFLWDRFCRRGGGILADDMGTCIDKLLNTIYMYIYIYYIDIISGHSGPASEFLDAHNNPDEFDFALLQCLANIILRSSQGWRGQCAQITKIRFKCLHLVHSYGRPRVARYYIYVIYI